MSWTKSSHQVTDRPKVCTTCHCRIAVGDWYWVEQRWRECSTIRRTGEVRNLGPQPTHHYYCDEHEPLTPQPEGTTT